MNRARLIPAIAVTALAALIVTACGREQVAEPYRPTESHERYSEALRTLGIGDSALAESWFDSAERALNEPAPVLLPVAETVYFDPYEAEAAAYEFPVPRGQRVVVDIESTVVRYFADLFRVAEELQGRRLESPVHVASATSEGRVAFVPQQGGRYLLRVQPEILRGGRFEIQIEAEATLSWPIPGTDENDVWSVFGDDRDGGARAHHGIDIFARHGSPVVAVSDSRVRNVGRRDRGGKVVTLRDDELGVTIYYAHLSKQTAERGAELSGGDQVGLVGNSGNARATPAHLHFSIYDGGWGRPVDPWYFLVEPASAPPEPSPASDSLGRWMRTPPAGLTAVAHPASAWATKPSPAVVDARGNRLTPQERARTSIAAGSSVALPGLLPVREIGRRDGYVKLSTVSGSVLYAAAGSLESLAEPIGVLQITASRFKRAAPSSTAAVTGRLEPGTEIALLGYSGSYAMAREGPGKRPFFIWLPAAETAGA